MRLIVSGAAGDHVVTAEPFDIGDARERFAVHRAIDFALNGGYAWAATHVATGFRVASGQTAAAAIANARLAWSEKTPEQRFDALAYAYGVRSTRTGRTTKRFAS